MHSSETLTSSYLVIDNFLPHELALSMRRGIEEHFGNPNHHRVETHHIWNYWFVPGLYTYLRTTPDRLMPHEYVETFLATLNQSLQDRLGMRSDFLPFLSMYIDGCHQRLHNDSTNGRFAYVYSLTKPDRRTTGGETIIYHEGDLFRQNLQRANAGHGFYDLVEPVFNRLVIFDDRIPHAVQRVEGSMDPIEGRFVLHGHIHEKGPIVKGALTVEQIQATISVLAGEFVKANGSYHGPLVLHLTVDATGALSRLSTLVDRVIGPRETMHTWHAQRDDFGHKLMQLAFPASDGETVAIVPIIIG